MKSSKIAIQKAILQIRTLKSKKGIKSLYEHRIQIMWKLGI